MAPSLCALLLLALHPGAWAQPPQEAAPSCGQDVGIRNGTFALSDGYRPGSVLTYSCPPGFYAYPQGSRVCGDNGHWTPLHTPSGSVRTQPLCREIRCPAQLAFENGSFQPRRASYPVGSVLTFECLDGYTLRGPAQRVCQGNGHWDGGTPACDDGAEHCPNPGVPPGTTKSGSRYRLGERVSYRCQAGLSLVGSAQRVCTEAGEWSGAEPSCRAPFSYDRVEDVGAQFGASFSNVLGLASSSASSSLNASIIKPPTFLGRRLILSENSFVNIYLLVDSSRSVNNESFQIFKEWVENIVARIDSFEVASSFAVISYATKPKKIVSIYDPEASDATEVIKKTKTGMNFQDHGNGTGTNTRAALLEVYNMILFQKESFKRDGKPDAWKEIRHAIIVLTDGKYNMGGSPKDAVAKIEDVLEIKPDRKDYLDIYAFGIGTQEVDWAGLNEIASKKEGERHAFMMESSQNLKAAFEDVLDPTNIQNLCGLGNDSQTATHQQQNPWHVLIKGTTGASCRGSLVSDSWVLTAAHCFNQVTDTSLWRVQVGCEGRPWGRASVRRGVRAGGCVTECGGFRPCTPGLPAIPQDSQQPVKQKVYLDDRSTGQDRVLQAQITGSPRLGPSWGPRSPTAPSGIRALSPCFPSIPSQLQYDQSHFVPGCEGQPWGRAGPQAVCVAERTDIPIKRRIDHPRYNVTAKASQGITEFYDYDVSLVELQHAVQFSGRVRPICLPCTVRANRALKKPQRATCKDHELELLGLERVPAHFVSLAKERLNVQIKNNKSRPSCIAGAVQPGMIYANVSDVSQVVTDRFLCSGQEASGGSEEKSTCKGESGGGLFLEKKRRYFQVGVVSWGTYNPCPHKAKPNDEVERKPAPRGHVPRDFYVSLFRVQDWLRQHLGGPGGETFIPSPAPEPPPPRPPAPPAGSGARPDPARLSPGRTRGAMGPAAPLLAWLLALGLGAAASDAPSCDPQAAQIVGGSARPQRQGQLLVYQCPEGQFPFPAPVRECRSDLRWSPLRAPGGRPLARAECRAIQCPGPLEFDNGHFHPRQPRYNISQTLTFECFEGYTLRGPPTRTCLPNGKWSGGTAICDDGEGQCPDPGVPIGATKDGQHYRVEDRVRYRCGRGLVMFGSKERTCQESGAWSGTEPECRDPSTYDTPEEVSSAFIASLSETVEVADPNRTTSENVKRKIRIEAGGSMNIYLVIDASDSVGEGNFSRARDVLVQLIEKISSYGVFPRYGILTFATNPHVVVSTTNPQSSDANWVTTQLENLKYETHALRSGTNTKAALEAVHNMIIQQEQEEIRKGHKVAPVANSTRHVLVLMTDGNTNMGGSPVPVVRQIRELLSIGRDIRNPREDYLDIYVFGIGAMVNHENIAELASKKSGEKHVFHMQDIRDLQKAFHEMIDESQTLSMCGLGWEHEDATDHERNPWHVSIKITRSGKGQESCKGALISNYFVLTAAHCFDIDDEAHWITVDVGPASKAKQVEKLWSHPEYNVGKLRGAGIPEFYDYDVALLKLATKVDFSSNARPICLPCTEGTTRALRKPHPETSCNDHKRLLLTVGEVPALFVHEKKKQLERKLVNIKNGVKKSACEADAKRAPIYANVTDVKQVVTPRFLCTGGIDPVVDPNTCKGDSGGPLIIAKGKRYVQVGVISWGVFDLCTPPKRNEPVRNEAHARDFHLNLFTVLPWLREKLADEELGFI
ncbi:complement factor B [Mauremys mutica]|uniref:complement factor B n=1 Tax=Mauremys mutica TaxID=74926 RepID=UPI001D16565E|nr:complement factor B [Mauremys mutica]